MMFAEHFELVPVVAVEVIIDCFSADGASDLLCSVLTPELDYVPAYFIPFFRSGEYQFFVFPYDLPSREFTWRT